MTKNKNLRNDLKTEAKKLLEKVMPNLKQRTINTYVDDIRYSDNINSIRRIIRQLTLLKDAAKMQSKGVELTKSKLKGIRADNKLIEQGLKLVQTKQSTRRTYFKEALNGTFKETYLYVDEIPNYNSKNVEFTETVVNKILYNRLNNELIESKKLISKKVKRVSIKSFVTIHATIIKNIKEGDFSMMPIKPFYYNSRMRTISSTNNILTFLNDVYNEFIDALETAKNGSDWKFDRYISFTIGTNTYKSALGGSYIELPSSIANKKACVNIKNKYDDFCFDWCLIANKYYDLITSKDKNMSYHYKKYWDSIVRPKNIEYPVTSDKYEEYENLNNIQINVFQLENYNNDVIDIRTCIKIIYKSNIHRKDVVNLLLINEGEYFHYVLVNNLSRLFNTRKDGRTKYFCPNCLVKSFPNNEILQTHVNECANKSESERVECNIEYKLQKEGNNIMKFKNDKNNFKHPFHIVADFESTLLPVTDERKCCSKKYQEHVPNSFGVKYCSIHYNYNQDVKVMNNADPELVCKEFIETIEKYAKMSYKLLQLGKDKIIWKKSEFNKHENATRCDYCNVEFTKQCYDKKKTKEEKENEKVAHHDHITGRFISSLCSKCNKKFCYKRFIPVYLHNLKGYDSHLFINSLYKYGQTEREVRCIPNNEEKYISFSKIIKVGSYKIKKEKKWIEKEITFEIRFLDTIAFMNSSIESLVSNLRKGCKTTQELRIKFPNTSKHFKNDNEFNLMTQKGVYPYDYITKFSRLYKKSLPKISSFYSKLYDSECSVKDYERALNVWDTFKCNQLLDYHNLYLKSDVLLLADVWESFRNTCYTNYNLDCSYYFTAPGLSFDAMLKQTKVELELLTDLEMYEFCESGIRGGLSQISTRYAKANNKYMCDEYDNKKEDSYIVYLDANNLYGWAMSQYLPTSNFVWNNEEWTTEKIMNIDNTSKIGYMFEVDLSFPRETHDKFNNYVPLPENLQVKTEYLNEWQQEDYKESKVRKLCCSFNNRVKYVVNYRNLKLALSLGVKLEKVHRVLQFTQTDFMKSYINLNTELRKKAKNEFEKDFFKLMNNSVFGKTMENVRNRINFRLVSTDDEAWRVKNLNRFTIFDSNLVGVHIQKLKVNLCKPVYLGQTILDDSKYLMNDFHYNFMLDKIPRDDIDLLFTDTDSLCYNIRKLDFFQLMKDNKEKFDLSDYPVGHDLHDPTNKKVAGVFKSESIKPITEFVGLRAKLYSYSVYDDNNKHLRCKGVKKNVSEKELNINMYKSILFNRKTKSVNQNSIRSYKHKIFTETVNKVALSGRDDKVYVCDNNINTYNFGHYKTIQ